MIRPATEADMSSVLRFLAARDYQSMFPLSNYRTHGLNGTAKNAPTFWGRWAGEDLTDVLTVTNAGMVMPQCPTAPIVAPLAGRGLIGVIGPADQCHALRAAAGLGDVPCTLDRDEPHFLLELADITIPDGEGALIPFADAPRDLMLDWQIQYDIEALGAAPNDAKTRAAEVYEHRVATGSHMVLMRGGVPVAKAGLNAQLPDIVQVGGVFTPPEHRGQGHAKRVTALMLAQARDRGVARATLFASGDIAARAYIGIGFRRVGDWALTLFKGEQTADV